MEPLVSIGQLATDKVTGFGGTITGILDYGHSRRIQVSALVEGKIHEEWIDEERLVPAQS